MSVASTPGIKPTIDLNQALKPDEEIPVIRLQSKTRTSGGGFTGRLVGLRRGLTGGGQPRRVSFLSCLNLLLQRFHLLIQLIESKRPVVDFSKRVLETELQIRDSSLRVPHG